MEKIDSVPSSLWEFKGQEDYMDKKFLMATPLPIISTLILYLWFVLKFGPEFMKRRKAYRLTNFLFGYNVVQVFLSLYLFMLGVQELKMFGMWKSTCYTEMENLNLQILDANHYYFLAKVVELLDTVFFILRKKQRQVTFLHVYHHTLMVIATWLVVKYNPTDSIVFIGTINCLVHVVMYTYYALSVFPALTNYLWWKKYITMMQLIQFCLMFVHMVVSHTVSECKPAYMLLFAVCFNTVLFMYLFGDFYFKAYTKKCNDDDAMRKAAVSSNGDAKNGLNYLMNRHKLAAKMN